MKAKSLLIAMALSLIAGRAFAQSKDTISLDLIPHHYTGGGAISVANLMKQHDGSLVSRTIVRDHINSGVYPPAIVLGTIFYRFAPTSAEITDSLFVPGDTFNRYYMLDKNPQGEGNLQVSTEPDGEGGTNLRISHFPDDDFIGDPSDDVVTRLYEGEIHNYSRGFVDSNRGELVWRYYVPLTDTTWEGHVAHFDLDGTLKHDVVTPESENSLPLGIFSDYPLSYYLWDGGQDNLFFYVYDSLFQQTNSYMISKHFHPDEYYVYFEFNNSFSQTFVVPDGDDVVVAAPYSDFSLDPNGGWPVYDSVQRGVALARYELRTMQQKGLVMFNDYPGPNTMTIPMCLFKAADGCLYFVYRETVWLDNGMEDPTPITAVKMDPNLNVLWTRYIDTPKGYQMDYVSGCVADEDEEGVKIAVVGCNTHVDPTTTPYYTYTQGLLYFCLSEKESSVGISGEGMVMHPYCFYPNPVQAQLQMQFSPDVQPKQIELYDLQGRLVRTQRNDFKSIDMGQLPAGAYMMRVILEDGTVFSDKVVKE